MTKTEFVKIVAAKAGITQAQSAAVYDAALSTIIETLKAGQKLTLTGFGSFELKEVAPRESRNPRTGEKVSVPAGTKPAMKFGKAFKDAFDD